MSGTVAESAALKGKKKKRAQSGSASDMADGPAVLYLKLKYSDVFLIFHTDKLPQTRLFRLYVCVLFFSFFFCTPST